MNDLQLAKAIGVGFVLFALIVCPSIIFLLLRKVRDVPQCKPTKFKGLDARQWERICKIVSLSERRIEALHALWLLGELDRLKFLFSREREDEWVKTMAAMYIFRLDPLWKPIAEFVDLFLSVKFAQTTAAEWEALKVQGSLPLMELKRLAKAKDQRKP